MGASIETAPTIVYVAGRNNYPFQFYRSGIMNSKDCGTDVDTPMLAYGYGSENGQDYYLVKNEWGEWWGDKGYIKIANNGAGKGICGIQVQPIRAVAQPVG